jgi:glycosyltransferase involved in cell wall biosynthesis
MHPGKIPAPVFWWRLISLVRRIRPDLIHGWMYHGNLAAQFARRFIRPRIPVLWSIHHSIGELSAEKKMTARLIRLGARLSGLPDKIVYASHIGLKQHMSLGYRDNNAMLIPNGVDTKIFIPSPAVRNEVRRELGIHPGHIVIGLLARYHPMKDHENFLRAAGLLCSGKSGDGIQFVLAGTQVDTDNQALQALIGELEIRNRVHLLGERQDTHRILAALDLFSLSSARGEALPVVLLEAMSCAVPCITTDVGDAGLLVGSTGRVVKPRDPGELAAAWEELILAGEETRRKLGEDARSKILEHYTLSATGAAYRQLYKELTDG